MRVIVCGGREYADRRKLFEVMDSIHAERPITFLWHGNARGADSLADLWGWGREGVNVTRVPAQWKKHGKRAGPIRNQNMLGQGIDLVIAFPGGRGTADMVRRAKAAGVEVREVE